jgi:hypothetical protein
MAIFKPGSTPVLEAPGDTRVMLLGGAKLAGERWMDWNFVSSSKERIEKAKDDWQNRRFPLVPGDEVEFVPLPTYSARPRGNVTQS